MQIAMRNWGNKTYWNATVSFIVLA